VPLQLTFCPHALRPPQSRVQELAVQLIPQPHALVPGQLTVHALPPHEMGPHALVPEHVRSQLDASVQSMPWLHELRPPHTTLHATPFGHFTFAGHGLIPSVQSITHTLPWHVPMPLHASAHEGNCASGPASFGFGPESVAAPPSVAPVSSSAIASPPAPASPNRSLADGPPHATRSAARAMKEGVARMDGV
jgi:hypothetical protein